jgi:hypothetical protein
MDDTQIHDSELSPQRESVNAHKHLGKRPKCPCCGGGAFRDRPGFRRHVKAKSAYKTRKSRGHRKVSRVTIRKPD